MKIQVIMGSLAATAMLAAGCSSSGGGSYGAAGGNTNSTSTGSSSSATTAATTVAISVKDGHFVGPDGKSLYTNNVDTTSKITCVAACATAWPPVIGTPKVGDGLDQGDFATAMRPDGTMQATYDGKPLYEFSADTAPGDTHGDGYTAGGFVWSLSKSDDDSSDSTPAASTSSASDDSNGGGSYGY